MGAPFRPPSPLSSSVHRCLQGGLGSTLGFQSSLRSMDRSLPPMAYQCPGAGCCQASSGTLGVSLKNQVVLVATDDSTVISYISKQGRTRSQSLLQHTRDLLVWCQARGIQIRARHIPGRLKFLPYSLSRKGQILPTEWSLCPRVFAALCNLWGTPMVDLFTTRW